MNINKVLKNFITPQYTVAEILLASILTIITIFFVFNKESFILEFFLGVILTLMLSVFTLTYSIIVIFFKKNDFHKLKTLQILGMFLILIIAFCYIVTSLTFVNLNNVLNYVFIFYALLTILRVFLIIMIIRNSDFEELKKYIKNMPLAKTSNINFLLIFVIIIVGFVYYQNIEILSIALGRSFFIGMLSLEIITNLNKTKRRPYY